MKNIFVLIFIFISCSFFGQIVSLEIRGGEYVEGAYYKDIHNVFNQFEGTWLFQDPQSQTNFTLKLAKKMEMETLNDAFEDDLVGELRYEVGGVEIINTLSNIDVDYNYAFDYTLSSSSIIDNNNFYNCTDCLPNEKRVLVGYVDPVTNRVGEIMLKKTIDVNGNEALKICVSYHYVTIREGDPAPPSPIIQGGWYTLTKQ